jgi:hypothetical protein
MSRQINQDGTVVVTASEEPEKALEHPLTDAQKEELVTKLNALKQALSEQESNLKSRASSALSKDDINWEMEILININHESMNVLTMDIVERGLLPEVRAMSEANLLAISKKYAKILAALPI